MLANWTKLKRTFSSFNDRYYCVLLMFIISGSTSIIYWQYCILINNIRFNIEKEIAASKAELAESFAAYNNLLKIVGTKIVEYNIANNHTAISDLLKQFYIASGGHNSSRIELIDINWQGISSEQINRYGSLPAIKFSKEVENNVRTFPNQAYLFDVPNENNALSQTVLLAMGIIDNKKSYIGRLSLTLDFGAWINRIGKKISEFGLIASITNKNDQLLFISDQSAGIQKDKDFIITHNLILDPYNYNLTYGYNKHYLYSQLIKESLKLLFIFWATALTLAILHLLYQKKFKEDTKQSFNERVNTLIATNLNHLKEKQGLKTKLSKQVSTYKKESREHADKIYAIQISDKERGKFQVLLANRISTSLLEIKEIARVLIESLEGSLNIAVSYEQQLKLLSSINDKLAYLSLGCIIKEKNELIDLRAVINDSIKIFTKEILALSASVQINIDCNVKPLRFDELLFRQLLVNILHHSISDARPKGKIEINVITQKTEFCEQLNLIIKDDGFGVSAEYSSDNIASIQQSSAISLSLELQVIKELVESFKGKLEVEYIAGTGKTIMFSLLYEEEKPVSVEGGNVVLFRKN